MTKSRYKRKRISLREISDNKSSISSTRWAFGTIVIFDIIVIAVILVAYIVAHFMDKEFDSSFINGVVLLLGIPTGIITTSKALQGFETKKDDKGFNGYEGTLE